MGEMVLLGVGTAVSEPNRECTHMFWRCATIELLIDVAGNTFARLMQIGSDPQRLSAIILTHSHADHIYGLPIFLTQLYLLGRREAIPIYGLEPTIAQAQALIAASAVDDYIVPVDWKVIEAGDDIPLSDRFRLRTALTAHSRPCIALRFEEHENGRVLVYSADTSPCEAVARLAQGCDLLLHEATTKEPFAGHTTPFQVGEVAQQAGAKRLVLVHYSPRWTMPEEEALAAVRAAGYTGLVEIGQEFQVLEL
jgi:ribonuclease Z